MAIIHKSVVYYSRQDVLDIVESVIQNSHVGYNYPGEYQAIRFNPESDTVKINKKYVDPEDLDVMCLISDESLNTLIDSYSIIK